MQAGRKEATTGRDSVIARGSAISGERIPRDQRTCFTQNADRCPRLDALEPAMSGVITRIAESSQLTRVTDVNHALSLKFADIVGDRPFRRIFLGWNAVSHSEQTQVPLNDGASSMTANGSERSVSRMSASACMSMDSGVSGGVSTKRAKRTDALSSVGSEATPSQRSE